MLSPLAACGGDGGGGGGGGGASGDEREIRTVLRESFTTDTPRPDCRERLSDAFIERTFRTRDRCVEIQMESDGDPADAIEISAVEVRDAGATAEIELRGSDVDGASGELDLVREGGGWRIDEVSAELLRSLLRTAIASAESGGELAEGAEDCIVEATRELGDAEIKEFAYGAIGETGEGTRGVLELLAGCDGPNGVSLLRDQFEQGLDESLGQQDLPEGVVQCIKRQLREDLPDAELVGLLAAEDVQALAAAGMAAGRDCGQGGGGEVS